MPTAPSRAPCRRCMQRPTKQRATARTRGSSTRPNPKGPQAKTPRRTCHLRSNLAWLLARRAAPDLCCLAGVWHSMVFIDGGAMLATRPRDEVPSALAAPRRDKPRPVCAAAPPAVPLAVPGPWPSELPCLDLSTESLRKYTDCAPQSVASRRHSSNSNRADSSGVHSRRVATPFPATKLRENAIHTR